MITLREVRDTDLPTFWEHLSDPAAQHVAADATSTSLRPMLRPARTPPAVRRVGTLQVVGAKDSQVDW